jgi:hypothetical protein
LHRRWPGGCRQLTASQTFGNRNRAVIYGVLSGYMHALMRARVYLSIVLVWLGVLVEAVALSALALSVVWLIRSVQ